MRIKEVITSEYKAVFIAEDGSAWANGWVDGTGAKLVPYQGGHKFITGRGGLYNTLLLKANGDVYVNDPNKTTLTHLQYDIQGSPFTATAVECKMRTYLAIRTDGSIWLTGYNSSKWFGTDQNMIMTKWNKIPGQPPVKFKQVVKGLQLIALTTDGDVYTLADSSATWVKKTLPGKADRIFASDRGSYIALIDGLPYGWGQSRYLTGTTGNVATCISLAEDWGLAGRTILDLAINDNATHFITSDNKLYGFGDNAQGEVGVGWELVNRKEIYKGTQYVWNWVSATSTAYQSMAFVTKPVQLRPELSFTRVFGGGTYAYYKYTQDTSGNLYSWGRNKAVVLGNGMAVSNESQYPNALDVTIPTLVDPFAYVIKMPQPFIPGNVSAGSAQITETGQITLSGVATPSSWGTLFYNIVRCEWTKLSGPECTIEDTTTLSPAISDMPDGTYVFELKVTDSNGGTMTSTVTVTAKLRATPPNVSVSKDQILIGSWTWLTVVATGQDIDSYKWEKVSGPQGDILITDNKPAVVVSFIEPGMYVYKCTVRNIQGLEGSATLAVTVPALKLTAEVIIR